MMSDCPNPPLILTRADLSLECITIYVCWGNRNG